MTPLLKEVSTMSKQLTVLLNINSDVLYSESNRFTMNGVKQQYIHFYKLRNECST